MPIDPAAVYDLAMRLTEPQRVVLVEQLLDSLPPPDDVPSVHDPEFGEELERRRLDPAPGIPWETIRDEM